MKSLVFLLAGFAMAANFRIEGSRILDPGGRPFVPIGANVAVDNYYDWRNFLDQAGVVQSYVEDWRFNTARANMVLKESSWGGTVFGMGWSQDSARTRKRMDALVDSLTPKGVVVMFEVHDWTGSYPNSVADYRLIRDFWAWAAKRYEGNDFVWFNLWNEPGWESPVSPLYLQLNRRLVELIRDTLNVDNIIVIDGAAYGQDAYSWTDDQVWEGNSGILRYGKQIQGDYANILFSLHLYDQWGPNDVGAANRQKFRKYIQAVKDSGLALVVGEVGAPSALNFIGTTQMAYEIGLLQDSIGMLAWHWEPRDGFRLVDGSGAYAGFQLDNPNSPSNLSSWMGVWFWKATHESGFGLQEDATTSIYARPRNMESKARQALKAENFRNFDMLGRKGNPVSTISNK